MMAPRKSPGNSRALSLCIFTPAARALLCGLSGCFSLLTFNVVGLLGIFLNDDLLLRQ